MAGPDFRRRLPSSVAVADSPLPAATHHANFQTQTPPAHLLCLKLLPFILLRSLQIAQLSAIVTQPPSPAGDSGGAQLALLLALRGRLALSLFLGAPLRLALLNLSLGV